MIDEAGSHEAMQMSDKRSQRRFNMFADLVTCSISSVPGQAIGVADISSGGLGITTTRKLQKGDRVHIEIRLTGDGIPIFVSGEIKWVVKEEGTGTFKSGVHITHIEKNDRMRLVRFLHNGYSYM
ncbi:MAG: PilZ domain-containing protein [Candidatus Omnitrophica bacterium]|nr:PilZ domain-containing protein [Candidatus Omnitrophota bacterium]